MSSYQLIELSDEERLELEVLLKQTAHAREHRRIVAVLKIADGDSPELVADSFEVNLVTVYRWIDRYRRRRRATDLLEKSRRSRPSKLRSLSEKTLERLLNRSLEDFGYHATTWTVAVLCVYIEQQYGIHVSGETMRQRLHRQDYRWKRPRYVYHATDPHKGQKKGDHLCPDAAGSPSTGPSRGSASQPDG